MNERQEYDVQFVESGEDSAESFESAKQEFDFIALSVHGLIVLPRREAVGFRRRDWDISQVERPLPGLITLIGTIHQQVDGRLSRPERQKQLPALRRIVGVSWREGEGYGCSGICSNQMNFGGPVTS
jgi:hypothetical protein